tara:strand:+ start:28 stop:456 length:429 start_codon:yes stop_codon:yes gene_type:complete
MANYIALNITNTAAVQPLQTSYEYLIDTDEILSIAATGAAGANAKTAVITLKSGGKAVGAANAGLATVTLTAVTSTGGTGNPTLANGGSSILTGIRRAMTANPGGVKAYATIGSDDTGGVRAPGAAPLATNLQMYWSSAVLG